MLTWALRDSSPCMLASDYATRTLAHSHTSITSPTRIGATQCGCGGARRRTLQIFSFACGMCEKVLISLFCWRVEQSDGFAGSCYGFHRFCFCCPFHGLLFHFCTRQFLLQCLTGVHGAFDRRHHRWASGTRSSTRCCSRAVASSGCRSRSRSWMCQYHRFKRKSW